MSQPAQEANFDGIVGPTHNYAGLSSGNVASQSNRNAASNPREAALQGLAKMKRLADQGFLQGVLPPHERPHLPTLRQLGFAGADADVLRQVSQQQPSLLAAVSSASAMWTANAATVSPSADTRDHRVHFTPANLNDKFHRSIEHHATGRVLKSIFSDETYFAHHHSLPPVSAFGDEGAANHTRLCSHYGEPGLELFVYGRSGFDESVPKPSRYNARQTLEASQAIARMHGLREGRAVFAQQNPEAIDAGVFHNDVIAVGNGNTLFYHEQAFLDESRLLDDLNAAMPNSDLRTVRVPASEVPMGDAVSSYLFNSQLLSGPDGGMTLLVPGECQETASVKAYLDRLMASDGPITHVEVADLRQSMRNGGGPACLRLRVVLTGDEIAAMHDGVLMTDSLYKRLVTWVEDHYRDEITPEDLADPRLLEESRDALDELTGILGLGSIYEFQW